MLKQFQEIIIQSYKHDKSLHRTWSKAVVLEVSEKRTVVITDKAWVIEADGRRWITREPAICFFYPDRWFNVIAMIRKSGIYYYCNLATPSIYDGEALKNIDYDLDVKVYPDKSLDILDEDEFKKHSRKMEYPSEIEVILRKEIEDIKLLVSKELSPFNVDEINEHYKKYMINALNKG